jgi:cell division protein FtsN
MREQRPSTARAVISLDRAQLVGLGFFAVLSGGLMFGLGYASGKTRRQWEPTPPATGIAKVEQNHAIQQEMKKDNVDLTFYKALVEKDKEPKPEPKKLAVAETKVEPKIEPKIEKEPPLVQIEKPTEIKAEPREPVLTSTLPAAPPQQAEIIFEDKAIQNEQGNLTIQVSAFKSDGEAQAYVKLLGAKGFKAQVVTRTINGQNWYKVRIGRFSSAAAVEKYKQKLTRENIPAWVVQAD